MKSLKKYHQLTSEIVFMTDRIKIKEVFASVQGEGPYVGYKQLFIRFCGCNLNCSYCFASQGKYHGERALMSFEVGKQALDFLIANSGTRRNLEVDFFGGEPLMNWEVVKELVTYAREQEKIYDKN